MSGSESADQPAESTSEALEPDSELQSKIRAAKEKYLASRNRPIERDVVGRALLAIENFLRSIRWSRIGKRLPSFLRMPLSYVIHVVAIYDHHRLARAGVEPFYSDLDEFFVSSTEHVNMPSIFVIEMFPPSEIAHLKEAQRKHGWGAAQLRVYPDLAPRLDEARSGARGGWQWWHLGAVVRRGYQSAIAMDPDFGDLPQDLDVVELKALQIGEGITAILAHFQLTSEGAKRLDGVWHRDFQPEIHWGEFGGRWPQATGKQWVAFRQTQEARGAIHDRARGWLREKCPGVFAANGQPQPLLDVLIFDEADATLDQDPGHAGHDRLRALGLPNTHDIERSDQIPGMVLALAEVYQDSEMEDRRTWALWGKRAVLLEALKSYSAGLGMSNDDHAVARYVEDAAEEHFLRMSISELLSVYQWRYSELRDNARQSHSKFRMKYLKALRSNLLTLSLDLASIANDIRNFNAHGWMFDRAKFVLQEAPYSAERARARGLIVSQPINLNRRLYDKQAEMLVALREVDRNLREILTSAASLTSSMQSLRSGRVALWVALASLVVAATTLLFAEAPQHSQLNVFTHAASVVYRAVVGFLTGLF
jgi:hypothetical protein